jgi:peptidoglycan L-alanyl-D-glutamate endopeptidase CwlK
MKNSRSLDDLHPIVRAMCEQHLLECQQRGIDILVTSTLRDHEAQEKLYQQGRYGNPGLIVTNARGGDSWHNWGMAYDVVPLRHGKPVWGTTGQDLKLWTEVGILGKLCGLEWAGDWVRFREYPHFQYTGGLTLADMKAGRRLGEP